MIQKVLSLVTVKTVLLIEDDAVFKTILVRLLEGHVTVVHAPNAAAALEQLSRERPDAVILDGLLPDADGAGFLTQHAAQLRGIPVIFASAFWRDLQSFRRLKALGVHTVLNKPVSPRELLRALDAILGTSLADPQQMASVSARG